MSLRVRLLFNFPTYKVLAVSIVSVIVGIASIALSAIGLVNQIWGHFVASGIWCGGVIILCGLFGITASQTRGVCVVKTFMVLAVMSCLASLAVVALSCGGVISESRFYPETAPRHPNTKMIHGMLIGTSALQFVLSLICAVICVKHVCCPPKPKRQSVPVEPGQEGSNLRRGDLRESQSSAAPLLSRHRRANEAPSTSGPPCEQESTNENELTGSRGHHSRDKERGDKKRHKDRSSDRSDKKKPSKRISSEGQLSNSQRRRSSDRDRRHSSDRDQRSSLDRERHSSTERDNRTQSVRNKSPDRYANKPNNITAPSEESLNIEQTAGLAIAMSISGVNDNSHGEESVEHLILQNNMEGLPPYEEVVGEKERNVTATDSFFDNEVIFGSASQPSQDSIDQLAHDMDTTRLKEIDAEQEALLYLSAAIQSPTSPNSGVSNLLSDTFATGCTLSSLSENSNSIVDHARKLSNDLIIHSQENSDAENDGNFATCLSQHEKQSLLEKYCSGLSDPQGVVYKEFSRQTDVIRETVDAKPKRSKSFQHSRERDFARGKSVSSRQLSYDENDDNGNIVKNTDLPFRQASKSFSRTPSVPGKPPPKPPRTSSLRQNGNKERPKSATLPYSHFAALKILETGQGKDDVNESSHTNRNSSEPFETILSQSSSNYVHNIQPPRFRYPRAKLTKETFAGPVIKNDNIKDSVLDTSSVDTNKMCSEISSVLSHSAVKPKTGRGSFSLPLTPSSENDEEIKSPLKSPTDYSAIPLKDILLKGQGSSSATRRQSDLELSSGNSEEDSPEASSSSVGGHVEDGATSADDRGSQNLYDSEGKPMYSFLL